MRSILVTGGAGFIGANFLHYWASRYPDEHIVVLDALTYAGNRASISSLDTHRTFRFIHGDICDQEQVEHLLLEERIDTIVHFAAESHVDRSILGPDAFIETNVIGTHALLKAARRIWLEDGRGMPEHRFHHISTDEVYGSLGADVPGFTEMTPYAPNSPYAASKAASDHLVRAYHHTYGLNVTISNCSNNYGPYQFPEKLIPLCIINLLNSRSLPIYGDGMNIRDWIHVEDHCRGIELILNNGQLGSTYNIGGNCERTNLQVVKALCTIMDTLIPKSAPHDRLIRFIADRPGHDRRYAINCEKITSELNYRPAHNFEDGLRKTVEWYINNPEWWQSIINGKYKEWLKTQYGEP